MSAAEELASDEQTIQSLAADNAELRRQVAELSSEHEMAAALTVLDAVKDVALAGDAPGPLRATDGLIRLLFLVFHLPAPEPVLRQGGLVDVLYGKPVRPSEQAVSDS